jgi:hypothetical protein
MSNEAERLRPPSSPDQRADCLSLKTEAIDVGTSYAAMTLELPNGETTTQLDLREFVSLDVFISVTVQSADVKLVQLATPNGTERDVTDAGATVAAGASAELYSDVWRGAYLEVHGKDTGTAGAIVKVELVAK